MTRAFISSTSGSLDPYRRAAVDACRRHGITPVYMEDFTSDPQPPVEVCRRELRACAVVLLLLADRYGASPDGSTRSYTELEYEWAIEFDIPVLPFVAGPNFPWPRPPYETPELAGYLADVKLLGPFVTRVKTHHTIKEFAELDTFRLDAFESLTPYKPRPPERRMPPNAAIRKAWRAERRTLPSPPAICALPPYIGSAPFTGRRAELTTIDEWATSASPVMLIDAIGGTGKSALAWEWMHTRAELAVDGLAGRFWWSFYDGSASIVRFLRQLLGYLTDASSFEVGELDKNELPSYVLSELDRRPYLVVLDGFERLLMAYHQFDPSKVTDDEVDEDPRPNKNAMIDGLGYDFVRHLLTVRRSKFLITTRMPPDALQRPSGGLMLGVSEIRLPGLSNDEVQHLLQKLGVAADALHVQRFFEPLNNHPLLIAIVAGMVCDYRPLPGNFAAWVRDSGFELGKVALKARRQHILAAAIDGLDPPTRRLLGWLSVLAGSVRWDVVRGINPHQLSQEIPASAAEAKLDGSLRDLEDRGLLWWNRKSNTYDMHPIVRAYAHDSLDAKDRIDANSRISDHFQASPPAIVAEPSSVEDLEETIMLFRALTGSAYPTQAEAVWRNQLADPLLITLGANSTVSELLQPHRTSYLTKLPADLSIALHLAGRHDAALPIEVDLLDDLLTRRRPPVLEIRIALGRLTTYLRSTGKFAQCALVMDPLAEIARYCSVALYDQGSDSDLKLRLAIGRLFAGDYPAAGSMLSHLIGMPSPGENPWFRDDVHYWNLAFAVWAGRSIPISDIEVRARSATSWRTKLRLNSLLFEQLSTKDHQAAASVAADIDRLRRIGGQDVVPAESAYCLAVLGQHQEAAAALRECVAKLPRLHSFDRPHYVLSVAFDSIGDRSSAIEHALQAHRQAWADGPPFCHAPNLQRATTLLEGFGVPRPVLRSIPTDQAPSPLQRKLWTLCRTLGVQPGQRPEPPDKPLLDRLKRTFRP